jgi:hypothetical protein
MTDPAPGLIVLLSSGETLPSGGRTHEFAAKRLPPNPRIVILETPAGFEPNSDLVARKIKEFLTTRLQNYHPSIEVLPARRRGTAFSPDESSIVTPLLKADEILMGPGSPSYTVRQLRDSLALKMITARQRRGATLFLASAAALAFGAYTIPVYEIYKVGEDLHWKTGLNFFGPYGLSLAFVPHWNNTEGGANLDTSRCFMGQSRFAQLLHMLPDTVTVVGIDEYTGLIIDLNAATCHVLGPGGVTVLRDGNERYFDGDQSFDITELGSFRMPRPSTGIPPEIWQKIQMAEAEPQMAMAATPSAEVLALLEKRQAARTRRDWGTADRIRDQMSKLGWQVRDTPNGPELVPFDH